MPRKPIDIPGQIAYLSILDEDGKVDSHLMPDLPEDLLCHMHRTMLLSRRFDERLLSLQRQGRIGTFAPIKGQEAAQIGAVAPMQDDDWMVPSFRETAAAIYRGLPLSGLLLYNAGYNEGGAIPADHNDLPIAIPVGTQIPHAAGIGYGMRYRQTEQVVLTFFGDGATSEGDFHEGLNFAAVFQTPTIFLCQNNHWAISLPRRKQTRSQTLAQKALAYGLPGLQVDGNDATFDRVLVAVGRRPNTDGLGLQEAGVTVDEQGYVVVDAQQRTSNERLFAIGDMAGGLLLAHKAMYEGKIAAEVIAGQHAASDARAIPAVVYTDPQIAWCGLTEQAARARDEPVSVARFPWKASGRAMSMGASDGLTKLLIDPASQQILGVGIVGRDAEALIAEGVLAVEMGAVAQDLALTMHPHPTLSETLGEAAAMLHGGSTHVLSRST